MHTKCTGLLIRGITVLLAGLLTSLPALPALAHGEEEGDPSRALVLQALAYLANQPDGYAEAVADKVADALEAPDKEGVDLAKVEAAKAALNGYGETSGDSGLVSDEIGETHTEDVIASEGEMEPLDTAVLLEIRTLLQESVEPLTGPVTGSETGTTTMLDPMSGKTNWDGTSVVFAVLSVAAVLGGLLLARRWRSESSLRAIRAQLTERGIR